MQFAPKDDIVLGHGHPNESSNFTVCAVSFVALATLLLGYAFYRYCDVRRSLDTGIFVISDIGITMVVIFCLIAVCGVAAYLIFDR